MPDASSGQPQHLLHFCVLFQSYSNRRRLICAEEQPCLYPQDTKREYLPWESVRWLHGLGREKFTMGTGEMVSWVKVERIFTVGTGEMASRVKALVSKPDDLS